MKKALFAGFLIVFLSALHSCNNKSASNFEKDPVLSNKTSSPKFGGELRLIENALFTTLLPYAIEESVGYRLASQIHNSLLKLNPKTLTIEPSIAKSWEVNDEQTKYTFHLRKNVYFHDDNCFNSLKDAKLNPSDIVHTFELLCGLLNTNEYNILINTIVGAEEFYKKKSNSIEGIKIIDDSTVSFELIKPSPSIIYLFASTNTSITSEIAFKKYGTSITNGCGPFKYIGIGKDSSTIHLAKNTNYFLKDVNGNKLPYLDSIEIKIKKEEDKLTELFTNQEIMIMPEVNEDKVESMFVKHLEEFENKSFIVDRKVLMATNCYVFNVTKAPFDNIKVRKAFNYATNKKKLIENIMKGQARLGNKGIVPFVESFNNYNYDSIKGYEYNPEKAKRLLAEAGFPNGENFPEISLELSIGNPINIKTAKEFQTQIQNVLNIPITIEQENVKTKIKRAATGKHDMAHFTWLSQSPSPIEFLNLLYGVKTTKDNEEYIWPNISRFNNKSFDKTLEKALVTTDLQARYKLFSDAENILLNQAPLIILWYPEEYHIIHGYVKNLHINEMLHFDYTKVYLDK